MGVCQFSFMGMGSGKSLELQQSEFSLMRQPAEMRLRGADVSFGAAYGGFVVGVEEKQRQRQRRNTGILRSAQDDGF